MSQSKGSPAPASSASATASATASGGGGADGDRFLDEKARRSREKNRDHSRRSRERKKAQLEGLKQAVRCKPITYNTYTPRFVLGFVELIVPTTAFYLRGFLLGFSLEGSFTTWFYTVLLSMCGRPLDPQHLSSFPFVPLRFRQSIDLGPYRMLVEQAHDMISVHSANADAFFALASGAFYRQLGFEPTVSLFRRRNSYRYKRFSYTLCTGLLLCWYPLEWVVLLKFVVVKKNESVDEDPADSSDSTKCMLS